jgi:hypothetical protein
MRLLDGDDAGSGTSAATLAFLVDGSGMPLRNRLTTFKE